MESVDCVVIGAGVVGLAIARELSKAGRGTLVLERHSIIGAEASSRNSEVIHGGLYYPAGSLKAVTCVRGREQLYAYCEHRGVPYRRCGKLIVATSQHQLDELGRIREKALRNGVADLLELDRREARTLEPELECFGALLSPSTGIVDSHALMLALQGDAESSDAVFALRTTVVGLEPQAEGILVRCEGDADGWLRARWIVNSAGLGAVTLAASTRGYPTDRLPRVYLAKGNYFSLAGRAPFSRLVYPLPEPGGLGVHLTLDLAGQARFGPDVQWVDSVDYDVDPERAGVFYSAIRAYWPSLRDGTLKPAYAGIRSKISGPGEPARDFVIEGPSDHGVQGLVNLFGIESPGLTASLSLARHVTRIVAGD